MQRDQQIMKQTEYDIVRYMCLELSRESNELKRWGLRLLSHSNQTVYAAIDSSEMNSKQRRQAQRGLPQRKAPGTNVDDHTQISMFFFTMMINIAKVHL